MAAAPRLASLLALVFVPGCHAAEDPAERARDDARAIAMVDAAQSVHPPPVALTPEPLTTDDLLTYRLPGPACHFALTDDGEARPRLVASAERAMIKVDGRFLTFAADSGSPNLIPAVRSHYVGKTHALTLARTPGDGTELGSSGLRWRAVLTIRDPWDQIVFTAPGELSC